MSTCHPGYYRCESSVECVPPKGICDGYNNCDDGGDETLCGENINLLFTTIGKSNRS